MRNILILFICIYLFTPQAVQGQSSLCGILTSESSNEPIEDAKVYLRSSDGTELFTLTDSKGLFMLNGLPMGTYSLSVDAEKNASKAKFKDLDLLAGMFRIEHFMLSDSSNLVYNYEDDRWAVDSTKIRKKLPFDGARVVKGIGSPEVASMRGAPKTGAPPPSMDTYDVADEDVTEELAYEAVSYSAEDLGVGIPESYENGKKERAGQLTASEWNDLDNWDLWSDQIEEEFLEFTEVWKLKPYNRVSIDLVNDNKQALVHATVILKNGSGDVLGIGKTDNEGRVELFLEEKPEDKKYNFNVEYMGSVFEVNGHKLDKNTPVSIDVPCANNNLIEIMFVVDATGSMGDEIRYLQAEVQDVVNRIAELDQAKTVRSGAIFYRDHGDQYLSRRKELSTDTKALNTFIQEQRAGGGGDFPEAIDYALKELTESINWSEQAISKIAFLILDAPPHNDTESLDRIHGSIKKAAEKGIRLIPVTGSGINKSTEYLMKALSVMTNGTYLYLTDDSGIGKSHLDASNDKSEVELLNDLMVRVVAEMSSVDCFEAQQTDTEVSNEWSSTHEVDVFPNPTSDYVNLKTKVDYEQIVVYGLDGQKVLDFGKMTAGVRRLDVSSLLAGTYILVLSDVNNSVSLKLVVK